MSSFFRRGLARGVEQLGQELPAEANDRLVQYFHELRKWAAKVNLVARGTTDEDLLEMHFLDSLTLLPLLTGPAPRLLDIGSGAGFPGLVCAAVHPELMAILVEPRLKRASFLRHMVRILALERVEVLDCRIEDEAVIPSSRQISHITGRAVAELGHLLEMTARFAGGHLQQVIWMKGPKWQMELDAAASALSRSPFHLVQVVQNRLPFSGAERNLLIFEKKQDPDEVSQ
jgi:16S rRNA (guanine527-N7)-methyltransferase